MGIVALWRLDRAGREGTLPFVEGIRRLEGVVYGRGWQGGQIPFMG